jgi:hypothetical protein
MPLGPEPTFWEWVGFWVLMAVLFGGLGSLAVGRLPEGLRTRLLGVLRLVPGALIELARRISLALDWIGGLFLWVITLGHEPLIPDRGRGGTAPVNRFEGRGPGYVTSDDEPFSDEGNETPVAEAGNEPGNAIAMGQSAGNEVLPGNGHTRAQAAVIARLYHSGTVYIPDGKGGFKRAGQVDLIKLATGISPSGREDSDYAKLKAELDPMLRREPTIRGRPAAPAKAEELAEAR